MAWNILYSQTLFHDILAKEIDGVSVEVIPCTVLNMDFFDRLWKCGVVRESGRIVKCFDEVYDDFLVSDELRKVRKRHSGGIV